MKSIVIYYSWTGNTKQIAEAIHSGMKEISDECDIARLREVDVDKLVNYDLIGLGSPVIDFQEAAAVTHFVKTLPSLKGRYGFTFCTHGTCLGEYISRMVKALRKKGMTVTGWNDWYGSCFIPFVPKPYYTDGHPDKIDLKEAVYFGREILERTQRIAKGESQLIPRLPGKENYTNRYGLRANLTDFPGYEGYEIPTQEDWEKLRPRLDVEKCRYPKCTICVDNCPTHSINPATSPPISRQTCQPCQLWLCEQLCPTGAIEVDWEPLEKRVNFIKSLFVQLAETMEEHKELRRFRSLITKEEGGEEPLFRREKHPKLVNRDGVVREHR